MVTLGVAQFLGKIGRHQAGSACADHGKFDSAFQLSDIAGPGVDHEQVETVRMQVSDGFTGGRTDFEQGLCEQWNIISPIRSGGKWMRATRMR